MTDLISALVSDHDEEASMVGLNAISNESRYPWV
jgi:hypothetical protein